MSDPVLEAMRAGAAPSDMRPLTERVWLSLDERYLVVCLTGSNYQCFERRSTGWVPADRLCRHVSKVLELITGRRVDDSLTTEHRHSQPLSQRAAHGIDGLSIHEPREAEPNASPLQRGFYLRAELDRVYFPDLERAAHHYLEDADRRLQELHPNMLATDKSRASVAELRTAKLRDAQRAAIRALLMLSDLEDLYAEKQSPGP